MIHENVHELLECLRRTMQFGHKNLAEVPIGSLLLVIVNCYFHQLLIAVFMTYVKLWICIKHQ